MYRVQLFTAFTLASASDGQRCVSGHCAEHSAEQASMLQRMNRQKMSQSEQETHKSAGGAALDQLFQATVKLLKTGATPDVLEFTSTTLEEITSTVLPAIEDGHNNDVKMLAEAVDAFGPIREMYEGRVTELNALGLTEKTHSDAHKACRDRELVACNNATECEQERQRLWGIYETEYAEFESIHDAIHRKVCIVQGDHTTWEWRNDSVAKSEVYIKEGGESFVALDEHTAWNEICIARNATHEATTQECNALKVTLETTSCERHSHHTSSLDVLNSQWDMSSHALSQIIATVEVTEADRKQEFTTLTTVQCLLNRIYERGGKPCDEQSGDADAEITSCHSLNVDTTHLDVAYPDDPVKPDAADAAALPCDDAFLSQEYGALTGHCFENLPPCKACEILTNDVADVDGTADA